MSQIYIKTTVTLFVFISLIAILHIPQVQAPKLKMKNIGSIETSLPIIQIQFDTVDKQLDRPGWFQLTTPEGHTHTYPISLKLGGNSAKRYDKRRYNIQFSKSKDWTKSINRSFFDFQWDDDFILDPMFADTLLFRNLLNHELYAEFQYFKPLKGRHVELFINGDYRGIYVFSNRIERKNFSMPSYKINTPLYDAFDRLRVLSKFKIISDFDKLVLKTIRNINSIIESPQKLKHLLYKAKNGLHDFSYHSAHQYILKSPKPEQFSKPTNLNEFIDFLNKANDAEFKDSIWNYFDKAQTLNYMCFLFLNAGLDNITGNYYLIYKNNKFSFAPWDLDNTFNSKKVINGTVKAKINSWGYERNLLFKRILKNFSGDLLIYWKRLQTEHLSTKSLSRRFQEKFNQLQKTGAYKRDQDRWGYKYNRNEELQQAVDWIPKRKEFVLQKLFSYRNKIQ